MANLFWPGSYQRLPSLLQGRVGLVVVVECARRGKRMNATEGVLITGVTRTGWECLPADDSA